MSEQKPRVLRLSDRDIDFLVETGAPEAADKFTLKQILREDEGFRNSFIADEKVFRRLMDDEEILIKISPLLFFEILLRKTASDLEKIGYTYERAGKTRVPVFDAKEVIGLLSQESLLRYLADMLSSFTKGESYTLSFMASQGTWKSIKFSDLDIFSLISISDAVDDEYRFGFYKRIADICLFILGMFPEYAEHDYRYPFSGHLRPKLRGKMRMSPEDYEKEGRKFYRLAAEHQSARNLDLSDVFWALHEKFESAKKPLNFITDHYLRYKRQAFFG